VLPAWVGWVNLVYIPLAFGVSFVVQGLLALVTAWTYSRARDLHWTARARRVYPLLALAQALSLILCMLFGLVAVFTVGPLTRLGPAVVVPALMAAVLAGSFGPSLWLARRIRPTPPGAAAWLRTHVFKVLFWISAYLAIGLACVLPPRFDATVALELALAAAFVVFIGAGGLTRVGRWLGIVVPAPGRLASDAAQAAAATGVPLRGTWLVRVGFANAFAQPLSRRILVTETAMELFDDAELTAVCVHEMGHLAESRWASVSRILVALSFLSLAALRPVQGSFGAPAGFLLVLIMAAAVFLWPAFGRKLERRSDAAAHQHAAPGVYARALEKLYAHELIPAVLGRRGSHPHLYDRLLAAGITPGYPRPAPPSRWLGVGAVVGLYLLLGSLATVIGLGLTAVRFSRNATLLEISIGLFGGGGTAFDSLAEARLTETGDPSTAVALQRQAVALSPESTEYAMRLAYYLALAGQCDESRAVMTDASARPRHRHEGRIQYIAASYGHVWSARCERATGGSGVRLTP
jgi:Zn-dependent protease with chaperone function